MSKVVEEENQSPEAIEPDPVVSAAAAEPAPEPIEAAADGEETEAPEYVPNRKFKFTNDDGEKEAEFEEWVGPILNKDNEEKFRDLFSKAHGLDFVKSKRDKLAAEKSTIETEYGQVKNTLQELRELREKDVGLFLEKIGLTEAQVAQHLLAKAEAQEALKDLPPHLQKLYNDSVEQKRQIDDLTKRLNGTTSQGQNATSQVLSMRVESLIQHPSIAPLVTEFDARRGEPGAFFEMVRREGEIEYARSQTDLSAEEAVQRALKTLGLSAQAPSQGTTPNGQQGTAPKVIIQQGKPAVIPNVGGGSAPTNVKKPGSIDDLRKLAKEMGASTSH